MKKITKASDIPNEPHYAILQWNPASGSGNSFNGGIYNNFSAEYLYTKDKEEWTKVIKELFIAKADRTDIKAFEVGKVLDISVNVELK